jgi:type IV pilus assembly protein PilV
MKQHLPTSASSQQGVVIIEALIAILIFSFGVLGIVGMQANMIRNTSDSKFRSDAAYIAQQRIGLMWSDPVNVLNFLEPAPGTDISDLLPNGTRTVEQVNVGEFVVTVRWQQPGEVQHKFTTTATITGG